MIKTLIFDFGNVVGFFDHDRTLQKLAPHTDMPIEEFFRRVYQSHLEDAFERGVMPDDEFLREVREIGRLRCDEPFLSAAIADIFWRNDEVCDLIPHLKTRYRLLLGSNTNPIHSRHFLSQFADVLQHFDGLVLSHEVKARKPEPDFFLHCLDHAAAMPAESLFIDDLPANVDGARQVGMQGLVYSPGNSLIPSLRQFGIVFQ